MSKLLRGAVAGVAAWKLGGGVIGTILIFVLLRLAQAVQSVVMMNATNSRDEFGACTIGVGLQCTFGL